MVSENSKKRDETAARIIKAIHESKGLLTDAAQLAGVCYRTVNRYVADYPSVKQAAQEAHERMVDFAESKLYEKIAAGDNACIIFFLKCQAKDRGYVERQENENHITGELRIVWDGNRNLPGSTPTPATPATG